MLDIMLGIRYNSSMEKPTKVTEETFQAFTKAMRNIMGPASNPSRNYLKRELANPTKHVSCDKCGASGGTLYKRDQQFYCAKHRSA
jgi:hypothetical protein